MTGELSARRTGSGNMMAFVVSVNGERVCTSGVAGRGVSSVGISWVAGAPRRNGLVFNVGGLDRLSNEFMDWDVSQLKVGDKVTIEIIEADQVDPPAGRRAGIERPPDPK
jgi:hypothetical protein